MKRACQQVVLVWLLIFNRICSCEGSLPLLLRSYHDIIHLYYVIISPFLFGSELTFCFLLHSLLTHNLGLDFPSSHQISNPQFTMLTNGLGSLSSMYKRRKSHAEQEEDVSISVHPYFTKRVFSIRVQMAFELSFIAMGDMALFPPCRAHYSSET